MKTTKRTTVTVETERRLVITSRHMPAAPCTACGGPSRLVTVEQAAALTRISVRAAYRMVEAHEVHFVETAAGALLICLNSLSDSISNQKG
ncbi:MAG TPA: hypothetical protein VKA60_04305 [Blastocatellia bacterium]|nr:hypothetical protein [Blastocatellia bacterium]